MAKKTTTKKTTATKTKSGTTAAANKRGKAAGTNERVRKQAIAAIDDNPKNIDGGKKTPSKTNNSEAATKAAAGSSTKPKTPKKPAKPAASDKPRRLGILDIAADILRTSKEPMGCKDIVEQAIASKRWTTSGKTPAATLYAAICREIAGKGKDSRFTKVDRGRFTIAKGA